MIKIDDTYNIILTYSPIFEITGHIFECFDYYLFLKQYYNKVGILFFCPFSKSILKHMFESKYIIDFQSIENDLFFIHHTIDDQKKIIISFGNKTKVIITDGNIRALIYHNIYLASKNIYGFMCEDANFHEISMYKHITYLQDYRIYGKNKCFKSINYVKKLPFKFYKRSISPNTNIGMIYMTYVCRKVEPSIIAEYHKKSGCVKSILIVPYKLPEYDTINNVEQVEAPIYNLFDKFDTYIYTPVNRKFDCSPRLVTECFMHHKKVFKDLNYYDIGLETRYNDCINNLEQLNLKENDKILEILNI